MLTRHRFWLATSLVLGVAAVASATVLMHRNLTGLTELSQRAFVGRCLSVQEHFEPGGEMPPHTEYTFEILETLKGEVEGTLTIRQYGLRGPGQVSETVAFVGNIPEMPVYEEDETYVLFLIGDSRLGLTSPVGLYQGAFEVTRDANGRATVRNGINNLGLFNDVTLPALAKGNLTAAEQELLAVKKGPVNFENFMSLTRKLIAAQ